MYHHDDDDDQGLPMPNLACGPPRSEDLHMALSFYQVPETLCQYLTFYDGGPDDHEDGFEDKMNKSSRMIASISFSISIFKIYRLI